VAAVAGDAVTAVATSVASSVHVTASSLFVRI
jgi:hypothetical protein